MRGLMEIDQRPCRESYGLRTPSAFLEYTAANQRQAAIDSIGQTSADGDRMASINRPGNTIPEMAYEACFSDVPELVIVPIERPVVRYDPIGRSVLDIVI